MIFVPGYNKSVLYYADFSSLPNMLGFTLPLLVLAGVEGETSDRVFFTFFNSHSRLLQSTSVIPYSSLVQTRLGVVSLMDAAQYICENGCLNYFSCSGTVAVWLLLPIPVARPAIWLCQRSQSQVWVPLSQDLSALLSYP